MGNHVTISIAGSQGHFQLNVFKPVIIFNILQSIQLLSDGCKSFTENCLLGIEANLYKLQHNWQSNLMLVTALNPIIGYEKAAQVAKKALKEDISLIQAVVDLGFLKLEDAKKFLNMA